MTPALARALARMCPLATLYARTAVENARLRVKLAQARDELAADAVDRRALAAHFELAVDQRNHARDLAVALADAAEWSDLDRAFLESGVWPALATR